MLSINIAFSTDESLRLSFLFHMHGNEFLNIQCEGGELEPFFIENFPKAVDNKQLCESLDKKASKALFEEALNLATQASALSGVEITVSSKIDERVKKIPAPAWLIVAATKFEVSERETSAIPKTTAPLTGAGGRPPRPARIDESSNTQLEFPSSSTHSRRSGSTRSARSEEPSRSEFTTYELPESVMPSMLSTVETSSTRRSTSADLTTTDAAPSTKPPTHVVMKSSVGNTHERISDSAVTMAIVESLMSTFGEGQSHASILKINGMVKVEASFEYEFCRKQFQHQIEVPILFEPGLASEKELKHKPWLSYTNSIKRQKLNQLLAGIKDAMILDSYLPSILRETRSWYIGFNNYVDPDSGKPIVSFTENSHFTIRLKGLQERLLKLLARKKDFHHIHGSEDVHRDIVIKWEDFSEHVEGRLMIKMQALLTEIFTRVDLQVAGLARNARNMPVSARTQQDIRNLLGVRRTTSAEPMPPRRKEALPVMKTMKKMEEAKADNPKELGDHPEA